MSIHSNRIMHRTLVLFFVAATCCLLVAAKTEDSDPLGLKGKPVKWTYCGEEEESNNYALKISDLIVEPNPPKKGEKVQVQFKGKLSAEITKGAKLTYSVKLGLIQLAKKTVDLCDTLGGLKDKDIPKCPIKAGDLSITKEQDFPSEAPAGKYTIKAEAIAADGKTTLICVQAEMTLPLIAN